MEVSEETVRVSDRTGAVLRCFSLASQAHLDVVLSDNRHRRATLLKGSKEYDLVRNWERSGRIPGCKLFNMSLTVPPNVPTLSVRCFFLTTRPDVLRLSSVCARVRLKFG